MTLSALAGHSLEDRIAEHLRRVGLIGLEQNGWTRLAFTREESLVHEYATTVFRELGCSVSTDEFLNLYGDYGPLEQPHIMLGTHLDTVRNGGNFDGVVGFIVAVETLRELRQNNCTFPSLRLAVFRAEESTLFSRACLGSRAAFLGLDEDSLSLSYIGDGGSMNSLYQAVARAGGSPEKVSYPTLNARLPYAYFETHIEQARVLEGFAGLDLAVPVEVPEPVLGIVTSIRAPLRHQWEITGRACISLLACCVIAVESVALLLNRLGRDAVATIGSVRGGIVGPDKINAVPGMASFTVRHVHDGWLAQAIERANSRGCSVTLEASGAETIVRVEGVTDHSGGAPMGFPHRRDALIAAAELILSLPTDSIVECQMISFFTDIRSNDSEVRDLAFELLSKIFESLQMVEDGSSSASVQMIRRTEKSDPVRSLSHVLQQMLASTSSKLGIKHMYLPSGAGHDAMMAQTSGVPTAMMFIPSLAGLSHNPRELSRIADIAAAVRVQSTLLAGLDLTSLSL
jgi:acetylornithine deacetylase/succinyl-diaminopimelate desuccinylase-like protein